MKRFNRAVFCYYILGFPVGMHAWLILLGLRHGVGGVLGIGDTYRQQTAQWLVDYFAKNVGFETVMNTLLGDAFVERNRRDIAAVERIVGRSIIELWDTDPIFIRYPHLRGLARNLEFEQKWARNKQIAMQKQK